MRVSFVSADDRLLLILGSHDWPLFPADSERWKALSSSQSCSFNPTRHSTREPQKWSLDQIVIVIGADRRKSIRRPSFFNNKLLLAARRSQHLTDLSNDDWRLSNQATEDLPSQAADATSSQAFEVLSWGNPWMKWALSGCWRQFSFTIPAFLQFDRSEHTPSRWIGRMDCYPWALF